MENNLIVQLDRGLILSDNDKYYVPNDFIVETVNRLIDADREKSDNTKRKYKAAIKWAVADHRPRKKGQSRIPKTPTQLSSVTQVSEYFNSLRPQERVFFRVAMRYWIEYAEDLITEGATPENLGDVDLISKRLTRMRRMLDKKIKRPKGKKSHTWLNRKAVDALMDACGDDLKGQRDKAVLILALHGLRRQEISDATFDSIIPQGDRFVIGIIGKGGKFREVPMTYDPETMKHLMKWREIVGGGKIARGILADGVTITPGLAPQNVFKLIRRLGKAIGHPTLASHDLRRTYSKLGRAGGVGIRQIAKVLGHSSEKITETYLNEDLALGKGETPADYVFGNSDMSDLEDTDDTVGSRRDLLHKRD